MSDTQVTPTPDYAAIAQKYGVTLSAPPATAAPSAPATAQPAAQSALATPDYAALAQKHGVTLSPPPVQQSQAQIQEPDKSALDKATDIASGFYHQTVGGAVNLAQQLYDQTAAYYKAHPDKALPAITNPANYAVDAVTSMFKHAEKDPEHPLAQLARQIVQSHIDTYKKGLEAKGQAEEALKNGDYKNAALLYSQAAGYNTATALPLVGPAAAQIGEHAAEEPYRAVGETGGLITSIVGPKYIGEKITGLAPTTVDIGGEPVPVRASISNPTLANRVAEGLATKEPLQRFDVTQTQPAARAAIGKIAESTVTKPSLEALQQAENVGIKTLTGTDVSKVLSDSDLDKSISELVEKQKTNSAASDEFWNNKLRNTQGDFGQAYRIVKDELSRLYKKADAQGMADGEGDNAFSKAQREEKAAFRSGNVETEDTAIAKQRELFDKANYPGAYDAVRKLYPKLDAIDSINAKFTARAVIKNTPSQFVKDLPEGQFDRGIVDGAALRTAVRELKADGTFAKAGVDDARVLQLQKLGDLLERSKVRPDTPPTGWFGKVLQATKNAPLGAGSGLAYLMTHGDALNTAVGYLNGVSKGTGSKYITGREANFQ